MSFDPSAWPPGKYCALDAFLLYRQADMDLGPLCRTAVEAEGVSADLAVGV